MLPLRTHLSLSTRTLAAPAIMGILNVTPDSFSDGGMFCTAEAIVAQARRLCAGGATILDVGAQSTRPGAVRISEAQELQRLLPALAALRAAGLDVAISVDTQRPRVAAQALALGADIINDVSASTSADMLALARTSRCPLVLMHVEKRDAARASAICGADYVQEVCRSLHLRAQQARAAGLQTDYIWLDPGIGFGKSHSHSAALSAGLSQLVALGHPVLYAASRKRFLGALTGIAEPAQRDAATAAVCTVAVLAGADIVRVHDAAAVRAGVQIAARLREHLP